MAAEGRGSRNEPVLVLMLVLVLVLWRPLGRGAGHMPCGIAMVVGGQMKCTGRERCVCTVYVHADACVCVCMS